jgi:hypothetical protein
MAPASPRHEDIVEFLDRQLYLEVQRLGLDWKVKAGDVGVLTALKRERLPDVSVISGDFGVTVPFREFGLKVARGETSRHVNAEIYVQQGFHKYNHL